jgi:pyrroline-5-carboxylate reductase
MGTTVAVIGTGNMGAALVRGLLLASDPDLTVIVYDVVTERAMEVAADVRVTVAASAEEATRAAQVVILAVKPKDIAGVITGLRSCFGEHVCLISSAAGVTLESLRTWAGESPSLFRIMPNLGVERGEGVIATATEPEMAPEVVELVCGLLAPLGLVEMVPEEMFDAVTAVSGSSIGFLALVLEGMEDGAVQAGMPRPMARAFVRQTALAGALLLRDHPGSAADIKDRVSSPAGTTIAGIAVLEERQVRGAFMQAVQKATERGRALRGDAGPARL